MSGVGGEVDGLHGAGDVAVAAELAQVAPQRHGIARDINDPLRPEPGQQRVPAVVRGRAHHEALVSHEHHGRDLFPDWAYAHDEPRRILEQGRRRWHVARGSSLCARLHPGRRFVLEEHPQEHLNVEYTITAVEHRGVARPSASESPRPAVYRNTFACVPADLPFVPARPAPRALGEQAQEAERQVRAQVEASGGRIVYEESSGAATSWRAQVKLRLPPEQVEPIAAYPGAVQVTATVRARTGAITQIEVAVDLA